jgi:hypothetical protein
MQNRMLQGTFRYGPISRNGLLYSGYKNAKKRLDKYIATGNAEFLIDAANYCMIEFEHPSLKGTYYESIDDGEHAKKEV